MGQEVRSAIEVARVGYNTITREEGVKINEICKKHPMQSAQANALAQELLDQQTVIQDALKTEAGICSVFKAYFQKKEAQKPAFPQANREQDRKITLNASLLGLLKGAGQSGAVSSFFGPGGLGAKEATGIIPGKRVLPGVSKEEIGRVIRRNLARFKYPYEKELHANPEISGKIALTFTIGKDGKPKKVGIAENTMKADAKTDEAREAAVRVETGCMEVLKSLVFPEPKGGGEYTVTYPFVFAAT